MRAWTRVLGVAFGHECSRLVSDVRARWRGIAARRARLHKRRRCCRMCAKARTGGERVQMWIGLGRGEFRVNRTACRRDCVGAIPALHREMLVSSSPVVV